MSKKPYPGYPPNYRHIEKVGGLSRRCMIIELLTLDQLSPQEEAQIFEALELAITNTIKKHQNVEKLKLVSQDSFDTMLLEGLRLKPI
jgi:hypothetical protein